MALIRNTLVFLDTGFFKRYKTTDTGYKDLLQYAKEEKIVLCTSYICLREWRSQKVQQIVNLIKDSQEKHTYTRRDNIIADEILSRYPGKYPDLEEIEKTSIEVIRQFIEECNIRIYNPTEDHIERTFDAYFNGDPPYADRKAKRDIPDSWIFEAAKDARFDEENKNYENRFCTATDKAFKEHLEGLGLKPIEKEELLEGLKREEDQLASSTSENATLTPLDNIVNTSAKFLKTDSLESLLNSALSDEMREIYIRVLGYTQWLSGPSKEELFSILENKGFSRQLTEASAIILSQASLNLIEDTGNHFLPINKALCEEAANLIMEEIIESLG